MVTLRPATRQDWAKLFCWRNDPETLRRFTSKQPVLLADHLQWLDETLGAADRHLLIASAAQEGIGWGQAPPALHVGTVRLDVVTRKQKPWATCSITVEPRLRGRGYGAQAIAATENYARETLALAGLIAKIEPDNYASLRTFADNGFDLVGDASGEVLTLELTL